MEAVLVIVWLLMAGLGAFVSAQKGRSPIEGLMLGLLFGPLGAIVAALLPTGLGPPPRRHRPDSLQAPEPDDEPVIRAKVPAPGLVRPRRDLTLHDLEVRDSSVPAGWTKYFRSTTGETFFCPALAPAAKEREPERPWWEKPLRPLRPGEDSPSA